MSPVIGFARALPAHPEGLKFPFAWLEAPLAARLTRLADVPDWRDAAAWPAGRLFGEAGEYRWQQRGDGLHAVMLLESGPLPAAFTAAPPLDLELVHEAALVLWGEWVDPERDPEGNPDGGPRFFAPEIPEIQTYPLELEGVPGPEATPRLVARLYRDAAGEHGEFLRCVAVEMRRDEGAEDG
jgi:hypothetical protein